MAERPIILFPEPQLADRDKRRKNPMPIMNKPTFRKQYNRLQPAFNVLKDAFEKKRIQIQNAPVGMNPEYALVFEVIYLVRYTVLCLIRKPWSKCYLVGDDLTMEKVMCLREDMQV